MRPLLSLLLAAVCAPLGAGGCAAPVEDDSPGAAAQADTVDMTAVKIADMKSSLANATLETREDAVFQYGTSYIAVAPSSESETYCFYRLTRPSGGTVRGVLKGEAYRFDGKGITLARSEGSAWLWTLPLVNERTQSGTANSVADFDLACRSRQILSAKQIAEVLQTGKSNDGQPSAARIVGVR